MNIIYLQPSEGSSAAIYLYACLLLVVVLRLSRNNNNCEAVTFLRFTQMDDQATREDSETVSKNLFYYFTPRHTQKKMMHLVSKIFKSEPVAFLCWVEFPRIH